MIRHLIEKCAMWLDLKIILQKYVNAIGHF
jgi:hypothetical protein